MKHKLSIDLIPLSLIFTTFNLLSILNILGQNLQVLKRVCLFGFEKAALHKLKISLYYTSRFLQYPNHNFKRAA